MRNWITNSMGVMVLTGISQILGYVREVLFAYYLGTSSKLEAFQMAETVPMLFTQILISAVPLALTPLLVKEHENKEGNYLINNAIVLFSVIMFVLMVGILCKTEEFVSIIAPGFVGDKFYLTCRLTTLLAPNILLLSLAAIFNAYLSSQEEFIVPTMIYLLINVFIIGAQVLTKANVYYVALASLSASIVIFFLLLIFMNRRYGFRIEIKLVNKKKMMIIGKSIFPVCAVSMFSSLNLMLDKFFASMCGDGAVVIFSYSYKIINLPVFLFTMSITKVMLPSITRLISYGKIEELSSILKKVFAVCIILGIVVAGIIFVGSHLIISILFGHGEFSQGAIESTAQCLKVFGFGIAGMALGTFCQSISYAFGNFFEPFKVLMIQIVIYMVLVLSTKAFLGEIGIVFANVVAYSASVFIWIGILKKKFGISILKNCSLDTNK